MNLILPLFLVLQCQFFFSFISLLKKKKLKPLGRIVSISCPVFSMFLVQECMLQWVRNSKVRLAKVNFPQKQYSGLNLNTNQMEHLEEEQPSQYPVERNPNAYRFMRDYMHPPWVSAPSFMVPSTNAPYGSTCNPSLGNHLNFSWKERLP